MKQYRIAIAVALVLTFAGAACSDGSVTGLAPVSIDEEILVPALRESVNARGQFELAREAPGELTADAARELAAIYLRRAGPMLVEAWSEERGASIDLANTILCPRAYYAASPYQPVADEESLAARMYFSSRWMVGVCSRRGVQVISLQVAARATHVEVEGGEIVGGDISNVFSSTGVPVGLQSLPMTPEEAVSAIAKLSGRRIASLPELILQHPLDASPHLPRWRATVEHPVVVIYSDEPDAVPISAQSLVYGFDGDLRVKALALQDPRPDNELPFAYLLPDGSTRSMTLRLRLGYSDSYRAVTVGER